MSHVCATVGYGNETSTFLHHLHTSPVPAQPPKYNSSDKQRIEQRDRHNHTTQASYKEDDTLFAPLVYLLRDVASRTDAR